MSTNLSPKERRQFVHTLSRMLKQNHPKTRLLDPLSWLERLFDKGLLALERVVSKFVEVALEKVVRKVVNKLTR